jgi:hypothetical protein
MKSIYREAQKPVNLEHSLVLTTMFRFKPASQFVEQYYSFESCLLNTEELISKFFQYIQ